MIHVELLSLCYLVNQIAIVILLCNSAELFIVYTRFRRDVIQVRMFDDFAEVNTAGYITKVHQTSEFAFCKAKDIDCKCTVCCCIQETVIM